jgi:hypothetical protein
VREPKISDMVCMRAFISYWLCSTPARWRSVRPILPWRLDFARCSGLERRSSASAALARAARALMTISAQQHGQHHARAR